MKVPKMSASFYKGKYKNVQIQHLKKYTNSWYLSILNVDNKQISQKIIF